MCDALAVIPAAGSRWYQLLSGKKKGGEGFNRFQSVNTKWNKNGEKVKFSRAWQKIEQQTTPFANASNPS